MEKSPQTMRIEDIALRLITPQKVLDPYIFDSNGVIHDDIRKRLLHRTGFLIKNTVDQISGLEVTDICITGSAATYLYYDRSDIDMKIIVRNKSNPIIKDNNDGLLEFLPMLANSYHLKNRSFYIDDRFVDIKLSPHHVDILGLYSVLNRQWLIKPNPNDTVGFSLEEIMEEYHRQLNEIQKIIDEHQKHSAAATLEDYHILLDRYRDYLTNTNTIKDYIVYKLLNYKRALRILGAASVNTCRRTLSF